MLGNSHSLWKWLDINRHGNEQSFEYSNIIKKKKLQQPYCVAKRMSDLKKIRRIMN